MIGVVIVSHSARLAEGVVELAKQVAQDKVLLAAAGGADDGAIGTDAFRVLAAIEAVDSGDSILVFMDLGSAVLSAETAIELLDEGRRARVRLCAGPLVEGAVAAVSLAAAGGSLDEMITEAERALVVKMTQLGTAPATAVAQGVVQTSGLCDERVVTLRNRLGLHARPAARLIRIARRFHARVTIENLTTHTGPFDAASLNGMLSLRGRQSHQLSLRAEGPQASQVIDELAAFVDAGCGDVEEVVSGPPHTTEDGIGASAGIAIGPLVRFRNLGANVRAKAPAEPDAEWARLQSALAAAQDETRALYHWARVHTGEEEAGIFDAQLLALEDPELVGEARRFVFEEGGDAAWAWHSATGKFPETTDMPDVSARVLTCLEGSSADALVLREPAIVTARDLLPSQVEKLDPSMVLGICLETGSARAHSAILARARGIPAVVGLGYALSTVAEGTIVAIDGERGKLWVSPDAEEVHRLEEARSKGLAARQSTQKDRQGLATTPDGRRITVLANLSRVEEAAEAVECGAEGVGVLRTEFLFLDRKTAPGEQEQFERYCQIAEALGDRPLVIRTLDIGGDKSAPYVDIGGEPNPFLGWRGIRLTLGERDLFETQLRAILRAGYERPVELLFPMVSMLAELREAKAVIQDVEEALRREGVSYREGMPVGVMIEVPSAAVIADQLAAEVSRLSIGTNDLVQYVMAADRTNARVARIADHFQPAVLRVIQNTVQAARSAGIRVDVCGEMAADPLATPLLLGLGVEELSMSPRLIPELKRAIGRWTIPEAEALTRQALQMESSEAVRELLTRELLT